MLNQVIRPQAGDHGIQLQHGILYFFAMANSMIQVTRPRAGDHGIHLQQGVLYLFAMARNMKQVISPRAGGHGIQLQLCILYFLTIARTMNQVIRLRAADHGIQLLHGILDLPKGKGPIRSPLYVCMYVCDTSPALTTPRNFLKFGMKVGDH